VNVGLFIQRQSHGLQLVQMFMECSLQAVRLHSAQENVCVFNLFSFGGISQQTIHFGRGSDSSSVS